MKKIFTIFAIALAMGFAFTSCASKKAADKGPKVYRVEIGRVLGGPIELSEEPTQINISSCFENAKLPEAGETIRVVWTLNPDVDINQMNVNLNDGSDDVVLGKELKAGKIVYVAANIPVEEDLTDSVYVNLWTNAPVICETAPYDEK